MGKGVSAGLYLVMQVIVLLIFLGVFLFWFARIPSNEQAVRINTELLRSKIHEACIRGESEVRGLTFPQVTPSRIFYTDVLPAYRIKTLGDPDFLLYYEAFPIGEGFGWEVYQSNAVGHRVFAPATIPGIEDPDETMNINDFKKALYGGGEVMEEGSNPTDHYSQSFEEAITKKPELRNEKVTVLVPNIMLGDYTNVFTTAEPEPFVPQVGKQEYPKGNAGEWILKRNAKEENIYRLNLKLTNQEKSFIKYRPCGKNSLCLKTPDTVTRIPISSACGDIDYIHLNYVVSDKQRIGNYFKVASGGVIAGVAAKFGLIGLGVKALAFINTFLMAVPALQLAGYGTLGGIVLDKVTDLTGWFVTAFFSIKESDFYIASPCTLDSTIKIKRIPCSQLNGVGSGQCNRWMRYPIYNIYVENNVQRVRNEGYHYQCVEGLGNAQGVSLAQPEERWACNPLEVVGMLTYPSLTECQNACSGTPGCVLIYKEPEDSVNLKNGNPPTGQCIQITVEQDVPKGFCWTKNPYREVFHNIFSAGNRIASGLDINVVFENTEFLNRNLIYVSPIKHAFSVSALRQFFNLDWKWPG